MPISELRGEEGRGAVEAALEEYDRIGADQFLKKYGYGRSQKYEIEHEGRRYYSKAIAGVAYTIMFPGRELPSHFGGKFTTKRTLENLGFKVIDTTDDVIPMTDGASPMAGDLAWTKLIESGRRSYSLPDFEGRERNYKLEIAKAFRQVIENSQTHDDWADQLKRALGRSYLGTPYNLSHPQYDHSWLRKLDGQAARDVKEAFRTFLSQPNHLERFRVWSQVTERHAPERERQPGSILAVGSMLNFALEPTILPPVKQRPFGVSEKAVGFSLDRSSVTATYASHLDFAKVAKNKLEQADLPIQDILDVQSVIWEFYHATIEAGSTEYRGAADSESDRSSAWVRDEIVLAYALLERTNGPPTRSDAEELSSLLRTLDIQPKLAEDQGFRGLSEVQGKLDKLGKIRSDESFDAPGGTLEHEVWLEFAEEPDALVHAGQLISQVIGSDIEDRLLASAELVPVAREGRLVSGLHSYRERDRNLTREKKRIAVETYRKLACEACGFTFTDKYGKRGSGFIECHHLIPLSELEAESETSLDDLALLCANCHRMIHATKDWLTMDELTSLIESNS